MGATIRRHNLKLAERSPVPETEQVRKCAACGGELTLVIDVARNAARYAQDRPRTLYFRCDRCRQIQIVEQ